MNPRTHDFPDEKSLLSTKSETESEDGDEQ